MMCIDDIIQAIRSAVSVGTPIGRIGGGLVPMPKRHGGMNILIVNCEYLERVDKNEELIIAMSRDYASAILRVLASMEFNSVEMLCIRFGYYSGTKLRETVYACNLPIGVLRAATMKEDFRYWQVQMAMEGFVEYSTVEQINVLLRTGA